jgi:hypothetical protein
MTAIGKLLAVLTLVVGLGIFTWSLGIYVQKPGWFNDPPEGGVDAGNKPVTFKGLEAEAASLTRASQLASEAWGAQVKLLEDREKVRKSRKDAYAERIKWAHEGNKKDKVDKDNPASPGKGFYEHAIDPATKLFDMTLVAGLPKGKAVLGTDGLPLRPLDGLLDSIVGDVTAIQDYNAQILKQRQRYKALQIESRDYEDRGVRMTVIRDSVLAERFFLETFEVNVYETRETVRRRQEQLRGRLRGLGIVDP